MGGGEGATRSGRIDIVNTTYLNESRPFIVSATGEDASGRTVEGIGISYISLDRATEEAAELAKEFGESYDIGYEVLNLFYNNHLGRHGIEINRVDGRIEKRHVSSMLPPTEVTVRISAYRDGKSRDARNRTILGWEREQSALEGAIESAAQKL